MVDVNNVKNILKKPTNEVPHEVKNQKEVGINNQGITKENKQDIAKVTKEVNTKEEARLTDDAHIEEKEDGNEKKQDFNFNHASKEEIITKIKEIKKEDNIWLLDQTLKSIKVRFDELYKISKNEIDTEFYAIYEQLKTKCDTHYKNIKNQKEDNLKKKEKLLEELRSIVDSEESPSSIHTIRHLQSEWKKIGSVRVHSKTLWASYNALINRYYDNRSIYFELKDLDRKKNIKLKEHICMKVEALSKLEGDMKTVIIQLNQLHYEYKHIGPVPKENQEPLWQRFKLASDAIYAIRKKHFENLKVELEANLVMKETLIGKVKEFTDFDSDRLNEWDDTTKKILEVQKQWEAIGNIPRNKSKIINKTFWSLFKTFFTHKFQFFKQLESKQEDNLTKKMELVKKAEMLKDSEEWEITANQFKNLQIQWKEIGYVPKQSGNEAYKKFRTACDHFFDKRRDKNQEQFKEYENNLQLKIKICEQLEVIGTSKDVNLDEIYKLVDNYTTTGLVPKNTINKICKKFDQVKDMILSNKAIHEDDRASLKSYILIEHLKNTPHGMQKLNRKEHAIKRKIHILEKDILKWNTNKEFFAKSSTADILKAQIQQGMDKMENELEELKSQLATIVSQK